MTKEEAITILSDIRSEYNCFSHIEGGRYHALSMGIEALKERKHGNWIITGYNRNGYNSFYTAVKRCSRCNYKADNISNFCPNCGADMRGGA